MKIYLLNVAVFVSCALGQSYEDIRCQCICPTPAAVFNNTITNERSYFKDVIPPSQCNCLGLIVPRLGELVKGRERQYCQRCECKFERRNTTIIMVVVMIVVWLSSMLTGYMIFLLSLNPLMHSKRRKQERKAYEEESQNLLQEDYELNYED